MHLQIDPLHQLKTDPPYLLVFNHSFVSFKSIQEKTKIKYSDILDVTIIGGITFAEGEKPVCIDPAPSLFLEITLKNGMVIAFF